MPSARNVTVHIEQDTVCLRFRSDDGREATVAVTQIAGRLGSETRAVMLAWAEDQKKPLLAQDYED